MLFDAQTESRLTFKTRRLLTKVKWLKKLCDLKPESLEPKDRFTVALRILPQAEELTMLDDVARHNADLRLKIARNCLWRIANDLQKADDLSRLADEAERSLSRAETESKPIKMF